MYGEINMEPERRTPRALELNEVGTAAKLRRTEASLEACRNAYAILADDLADVRKERNALRAFKQGVAERFDLLDVPKSGNLNDRLDLVLADYSKPVDPDLLAVRELCARDVLDFAYKAKTDWRRDKYVQMARDVRAGLFDDKPLVQNDLRIYKAGKAAK